MARAALASRNIGRGPRPLAAYIPAATVMIASLLSILPIISVVGWFPDFGFVVLIAWRLLRADVWPSWWAAPLGLFNDLVSGLPIGFSVTLWTAAMLALDMADRRTMWRDYWVEWALAAVLLAIYETAQWRVAQMMSASMPFRSIVPPVLVAILAFPVAAWLVAKIDRWRLGR
jgi:rod shape-determining protein MreD